MNRVKKFCHVLIACCGVAVGHASAATQSVTVKDPIPEQPVAEALSALSRQTGLQIVYMSRVASGVMSSAIPGGLPQDEALRLLLDDTGLQFEFLNERTVTVFLPEAPPSRQMSAAEVPLRLVAVQETPPQPEAQPEIPRGSMPVEKRDSGKSGDEVVVAGSRLKRGASEEGAAPVTVFNREQIDRLGVGNVGEVLDYLPQQSFAFPERNNFGEARIIQLRGLSAGTTLVLVDGRRTVTSGLQGARNVFDVNTLPLSAVDRIEVLSGSASAVYGADAVGGVVNIVLKRDAQRPTVEAYYGAANGGGEERRASVTMGHATERFKGSIGFDYYDRGFLFGAERDRFANQDYRRFGSIDRRSLNANPGNISSLTGANLPGLPSSFAAVPMGSTGVGLTPASFLATAGQRNYNSEARFAAIVPKMDRKGAFGSADLRLMPALSLFGDVLYVEKQDSRIFTPNILTAVVPAANPFNPFGQDVRVQYSFAGIGAREDATKTQFHRAVGGLRGEFGSSWDWEFSVLETRDNGAEVPEAYSVNTALINASLASTNPALALNVFQDGPGGSAALLSTFSIPDPSPTYDSDALQGSGFLRGPLFELPAGSIAVVAGAEWRKENLFFNDTSLVIKEDRRTTALFAETRIPLIGAAMRGNGAQELALVLAGRQDHYDDFGDVFNPQYGLEWKPMPQLLVRASYGTSFKPPSLVELHRPTTTFANLNYPDPARNNRADPVDVILTGGSLDLHPEESDSFAAGFVFMPSSPLLPRFEANYWRIEQTQRIQLNLNAALIFANESLFPTRITRAARTAQDIADGIPGRMTYLDIRSANVGALRTSGVDFKLSSLFETALGRFNPSLTATWVTEYKEAPIPSAPVIERVGVGHTLGTIPDWKATAQVSWSRGPAGLAVTGRYISSYNDANTLSVPNGRTIHPDVVLDLSGSLDIGTWLGRSPSVLRGLTARVGVLNVFNEEPPFSELSTYGYDTSQEDLRGRFGYLSLAIAF